jgi:hypothetical protein
MRNIAANAVRRELLKILIVKQEPELGVTAVQQSYLEPIGAGAVFSRKRQERRVKLRIENRCESLRGLAHSA